MKVVLFCGGLGTRLREHSETIPKPLVSIGARPIIWHLMRYYAHYGHKEFILCLGYRGDLVREYFLNYKETLSNDFTLSQSGRHIDLHSSDIDDWKITFVDTGLNSNIGQRLLRVKKYLKDEEVFLANYSDGLSDLPLGLLIDDFNRKDATASFVAVRTLQSFHAVYTDQSGIVQSMGRVKDQAFWVNGGYFVMKQSIFDHIEEGDELVEKPFARLIAEGKLAAYEYQGFWQCMDTFKDKMVFDQMDASEQCPWMVWKQRGGASG